MGYTFCPECEEPATVASPRAWDWGLGAMCVRCGWFAVRQEITAMRRLTEAGP